MTEQEDGLAGVYQRNPDGQLVRLADDEPIDLARPHWQVAEPMPTPSTDVGGGVPAGWVEIGYVDET